MRPPFESDDRQRVREASDIVRIVGDHVRLKAKGREYVGLCPFHDDHKPSMYVVPDKQIFHCFVCGAGGDVFTFVQRYHSLTFPETLQMLAEQAGIELTPRTSRPTTDSNPDAPTRQSILEANAFAQAFFQAMLRRDTEGRLARDTIDTRGISPEMVEKFALGASPDRWDGLLVTLQNKGLSPANFIAAGLLKERPSGEGCYDAFRNRLMFPIHNQAGKVIAFGARRLNEEDDPKYLNSSDSAAFNKSKTLYALPQAAPAIRKQGVAIVTEGYTDAIACHQAGFDNAVATLGTALTRDHAQLLGRLCDTIVLLFDSDDAGSSAADRAVEVFFSENVDVRIATFQDHTDAKDPDELLKRADGPETFTKVIDAARHLLDYRFDRLRLRVKDADSARATREIESEIERLVDLGLRGLSPIRRQFIIKRLASAAHLNERAVVEAINDVRKRTPPQRADAQTEAKPAAETPRKWNAAAHILGCLLCDASLWHALGDEERAAIAPQSFADASLERLARTLQTMTDKANPPDLASILDALEDESARTTAVALYREVSSATEHQSHRLHEHWRACLARVAQDRPAPDTELSPQQRLEELRTLHGKLPVDRRRMPRPTESASASPPTSGR